MEIRQQGMNRVVVNGRNFKLCLAHHQILDRVNQLAATINRDYEGMSPLFVPVLNGSFMFAADLLKGVVIQSNISFVKLKSYEGMASTGKVNNLVGLEQDLAGRHVIVLEDIVDTGRTISHILQSLQTTNPASVQVATLLFKPACLVTPVLPRYACFEMEDKFLVGYGLDYDGWGRNLPDIYEVE